MRKKILSAALSIMMIAASFTSAYGAEFSSGEEIAADAEGWEESGSEDIFSAGNECEVPEETVFEDAMAEDTGEQPGDSSEEAGSSPADREAVFQEETDKGTVEDEEHPDEENPNEAQGMQTAKQIIADQVYHDTVVDTKNLEEEVEEGDYDRFQQWYQFVPEEDGICTLGCKSEDEFVYAGVKIGTQEDYDSENYKFSYTGGSSIDVELKKGETYYIEVYLRNETSGVAENFSLMLRSPEPHIRAEALAEGEAYSNKDNMFSVCWHQFVPEKTGYYQIESSESEVVVYTDSKLEETVCREEKRGNILLFPLTEKQTYYIKVEPDFAEGYSVLVKRKLVSTQEFIEDILEREGSLPQLEETESGKAETDAVIYNTGENQRTFMQFVPNKTGRYSLSLYKKNDPSYKVPMYLYDSNFESVLEDAYSPGYRLEKGNVYYAADITDVGGEINDCVFSVERIPSITSLKVLEEPGSKVLYKGCIPFWKEPQQIWIPGIKVEVTYENGKKEVITAANGVLPQTSYGDDLIGDYDGIDYLNIYDAPSGKYTFNIYPRYDKSISVKIENVELKDVTDLPLLKKDGSVRVKTNFAGQGWVRFQASATGKYVFSASNEKSHMIVYEDTLGEGGIPCIQKIISETNSVEASLESGRYYYLASGLKGSRTEGWTDEVTISAKSAPRISLSKAKVTAASTAAYTGKAITPTVKVTYGTTVLKKGTDYTVSYSSNTNIGKAAITIKGIGNYTGTIKKYFTIKLGSPKVKSAVSSGYNAVKVTWNKVPGAKTYSLYYKGGSIKKWKLVETGITGTSTRHVSGKKFPLTTGTTYTYTVKAVKGSAVSTYGSSTKSVKVIPATVKLGKVTSVSYNQQKISWTQVPGATGYIVYQKINNKWTRIAATKATFYINKNGKGHPVVTGVTNTYTVSAYRKVGGQNIHGKYSTTGSSGKALLAKPVISKITKTSKGLKLQWSKISGAAGYVVQRYENGKWVTKKTIKSSKTLTYTDTKTQKGKKYKYRIAAYCNVNGKPFYSVYSEIKSKTR
ncbi:MAG: hypothetical protein Q4C77_07645 [Eubacteriales bacterium]|nr:hypothetical protein [Eubacteriales bacterium]